MMAMRDVHVYIFLYSVLYCTSVTTFLTSPSTAPRGMTMYKKVVISILGGAPLLGMSQVNVNGTSGLVAIHDVGKELDQIVI